MPRLQLDNIKKTYRTAETVTALRGVSLELRSSEFVSILGPSGCGKTTLLNIIGGLDRYDSGDLVISGTSTKQYRDSDWDTYRNQSIGFVFQNYNLISHQTVLHNVEIALTLSGVSAKERKRRATQALVKVGLLGQLKKKPNQLSGGQMQRVAIARALINDPDIILADEPTGALDSNTSVHIMEILKQIAKDRLVIMVTHNQELAQKYSTRIIRMLDGEIGSDSNPLTEEEGGTHGTVKTTKSKTGMSMVTATALSFKNLLTKKGRTITTAFAGSIGIIGVALVLALSTGLSSYISQMQRESLSGLPITIGQEVQTLQRGPMDRDISLTEMDETGAFTDENILYRHDNEAFTIQHQNIFTDEFFDYVGGIQDALPQEVSTVSYSRAVEMNVLAKGEDAVVKFDTIASDSRLGTMFGGSTLYWQEMDDNNDVVLALYDLIGEASRMPENKNEIALVVDQYNRLDKAFFDKVGLVSDRESYQLTDFIGRTLLSVIPNDSYYSKGDGGLFTPATASGYEQLYHSDDAIELTITGILRGKENSASLSEYLSPGFVYTTALTDFIVADAQTSAIAQAQNGSDTDVILGVPFASDADKEKRLLQLGADTTPISVSIYPSDYEGKDGIKAYLDAFNQGKAEEDQIVYSDTAQMVESMIGTMLSTVTYVLVAFAAVSLVVSTIMIAIIIYVSVIERTKEIGILRSVGARKKDISRVFNAEALLIGFTAGLIGVGITYLLQIPINTVVAGLTGVTRIASLPLVYALLLVLGSMGLTLIAGFIPSKMAANKDPVVALRTD